MATRIRIALIVRSVLALGLLACIAGPAPAQHVEPRTIDRLLWTAPEPFTLIAGVRELADGRLIAFDFRDVEGWLLSSSGARLRSIAAKGSGPAEFRSASAILALPGDSTLVVDRDQRRVLILGPDGQPVRTERFPPEAHDGPSNGVTVDPAGRLFFADAVWGTKQDPYVSLLRWDRRTGKVETVARLLGTVPVMTGTPTTTLTQYAIPYSPTDAWANSANGSLLLLRADYHADIQTPDGKTSSATPIPYTPVPLTKEERERFSRRLPPDARPLIPSHKPAFNPSHLYSTSDGQVWVGRYGQGAMSPVSFDVISSAGVRIGAVTLPQGRTMVAVTAKHVYAARADADGFQWLECYARP